MGAPPPIPIEEIRKLEMRISAIVLELHESARQANSLNFDAVSVSLRKAADDLYLVERDLRQLLKTKGGLTSGGN